MKFLYTLFAFLIFPMFAFAGVIQDTIYAVTPQYISSKTVKQNQTIDLYVLKTGKLSDDLNLENGEKIQVKILEYTAPKRGKRNGYFKVQYRGNQLMTGTMRQSSPKDLKKITKTVGVTVAGTILQIPGFSQAIAVSKGLIAPNANQTRLESAEKNLYQSTPLPYLEKGHDFEVKEDGVVVLKLKSII